MSSSNRPSFHLKYVVKNLKAKLTPDSCLSPSSLSTSSSNNIPSGFMAVYVGEERTRFLIPTRFMNLPIFIELLNKAEEEFQFMISGGIVLPCEVEFFREVLGLLQKNEHKYGSMDLHKLSKLISEKGLGSSCRNDEGRLLLP